MKFLERRDTMGRFGKKAMTVVLSAAMCAICLVPLRAEAKKIDRHEWSQSSQVWEVGDGVTAYVKEGVLYFEGTGAIPDYTNDTLYTRPWHGVLIEAVNVGPGITDIGTKAFAEFKKLRYITVYSTTFIKSGNAFDKIDSAPQVRIMGTEETTRMIGDKIPYTSLDSWARVGQSRTANIVYIMDNGDMKMKLRQKTLPNVPFVYSADNEDATHRYEMADHEEEQIQTEAFVSPLRFAPGYESPGQAVTSQRVIQGEEYLGIIAYYLNNIYTDYNYGCTYSNMVTTGDKVYEAFDAPRNYQFQIPVQLQSPGRVFKVVQIVDGQPVVLDDLDNSDTTITFATDRGTFYYSIIYK